MTQSPIRLLERGSRLKREVLMEIHDALAHSCDPYLKLCAGWAALYASQRGNDKQGEDAFKIAKERWEEAMEPAPSAYWENSVGANLKAEVDLAIAPQIRYEKRIWTPDERRDVSVKLASVAAKCIEGVEEEDPEQKGLLAEIACMQLLWRNSPNFPALNSVPAGPGKDRRSKPQFNTDIYTYIPGTARRGKGANVQVKSTASLAKNEKYDSGVIVIIGANTHFSHPGVSPTPKERILFTASMCADEAFDGSLDSEDRRHLDKSSLSVHRDIMQSMRERHPKSVPKVRLPKLINVASQ